MRYVALFRGINVGKAKRIAMADLRALLGEMGFSGVTTLLNSGNAVFTANAEPAKRLSARIRAEVARKLAVDALVVVKSLKDITAIIEGNALKDVATNDSRLLVAMANDSAAISALAKWTRQSWGEERVHVNRQAAYLWCPNGILESRAAAALLKDLAVGTTRNWATLGKIHALMKTSS